MKTVLVVDDDEGLRESICEVITDAGHKAVGAANGQEAFHLLNSGLALPDLILLDLMMPVMSGWEFRAQQKSSPRLAAIPTVVLTASSYARPVDVGHVVRKPIKLATLIELINRYLAAEQVA